MDTGAFQGVEEMLLTESVFFYLFLATLVKSRRL